MSSLHLLRSDFSRKFQISFLQIRMAGQVTFNLIAHEDRLVPAEVSFDRISINSRFSSFLLKHVTFFDRRSRSLKLDKRTRNTQKGDKKPKIQTGTMGREAGKHTHTYTYTHTHTHTHVNTQHTNLRGEFVIFSINGSGML